MTDPTALFTGCAIAGASAGFAMMEARGDASDINDKKDIEHRKQWIGRAVASGVVILVAILITHLVWYSAIPLAMVVYGSFTPVFRLVLNLKRKPAKNWYYISSSNAYDMLFIRASDSIGLLSIKWAGILAYAVELIALVGGMWWLSKL